MKNQVLFSSKDKSTVKPVLRVTQGTDKKWLLKIGDPLIQFICTVFWVKGSSKGGCLRQMIP